MRFREKQTFKYVQAAKKSVIVVHDGSHIIVLLTKFQNVPEEFYFWKRTGCVY